MSIKKYLELCVKLNFEEGMLSEDDVSIELTEMKIDTNSDIRNINIKNVTVDGDNYNKVIKVVSEMSEDVSDTIEELASIVEKYIQNEYDNSSADMLMDIISEKIVETSID